MRIFYNQSFSEIPFSRIVVRIKVLNIGSRNVFGCFVVI